MRIFQGFCTFALLFTSLSALANDFKVRIHADFEEDYCLEPKTIRLTDHRVDPPVTSEYTFPAMQPCTQFAFMEHYGDRSVYRIYWKKDGKKVYMGEGTPNRYSDYKVFLPRFSGEVMLATLFRVFDSAPLRFTIHSQPNAGQCLIMEGTVQSSTIRSGDCAIPNVWTIGFHS